MGSDVTIKKKRKKNNNKEEKILVLSIESIDHTFSMVLTMTSGSGPLLPIQVMHP